jgi:hypothetical protein
MINMDLTPIEGNGNHVLRFMVEFVLYAYISCILYLMNCVVGILEAEHGIGEFLICKSIDCMKLVVKSNELKLNSVIKGASPAKASGVVHSTHTYTMSS